MSFKYDRYIEHHRKNVKQGYDWLSEYLPEILENTSNIEWLINFGHDQSKNEPDEYEAYDAYFYGNNRSYEVVEKFNRAWLLHIHRNPHHWQHWVLINDDPELGETILEMPYDYIIEMICDWWSFGWSSENLNEIFEWYAKHSEYIKLGVNTRTIVEDILYKIMNKLENIGFDDELKHHGIKGQKWGVKNGPPYPLEKAEKSDIVRKTIEGHKGNPPKSIPNSISEHISKDGKVDKRAFYNEDGAKSIEIHTTNHGNPKEHPYGTKGEHIHYYEWYEDGRMKSDTRKELTSKQRKENEDIL